MIETERLCLIAWTEAERAPYLDMTSDPEVMADYGGPFDSEEANRRFDRQVAAFREDGHGKWALRRKEDGAYLGYCGVNPLWPTLPPAPGLEIGWRMVRTAWGRGYASEAAGAALKDIFARTDAEEVFAYTGRDNARSQAVMRRLGFRRDPGRDFRHESGAPCVVFVTLREAWT